MFWENCWGEREGRFHLESREARASSLRRIKASSSSSYFIRVSSKNKSSSIISSSIGLGLWVPLLPPALLGCNRFEGFAAADGGGPRRLLLLPLMAIWGERTRERRERGGKRREFSRHWRVGYGFYREKGFGFGFWFWSRLMNKGSGFRV